MAPVPTTNYPYPPRPGMPAPVHQMDMGAPRFPPPSNNTPNAPSVQPHKGVVTPRDIRVDSQSVVPSGAPNGHRSPGYNPYGNLPALPDNDEDLIDDDDEKPNKQWRQQQGRELAAWPENAQIHGGKTAIATPGGGVPANVKFDIYRIAVTCPKCGEKVLTETKSAISGLAVGLALLLFFTFPLIFFVPLILPGLRSTKHFCPKCEKLIGQKSASCGKS